MLRAHRYAQKYAVDEAQIIQWQQQMDSLSQLIKPPIYRSFDPNSDPLDTLLAKGLSVSLSKSIVNYREKVRPFRSVDDLTKLYVMKDKLFNEIEPYVNIPVAVFTNKSSVEKKYVEQMELFINRSSAEDWKKIRGIGHVLSKRIVAYKELLGGFTQLEQIAEVYGISDSLYQSMLPLLFLDSADIQKLNIAEADFKMLIRHPYLNIDQVKEILKARKSSHSICSELDLWAMESFDIERDRRLIPYLWFPCDPK